MAELEETIQLQDQEEVTQEGAAGEHQIRPRVLAQTEKLL
jgi:predicted DNA-binding protein (UPF0251 family)